MKIQFSKNKWFYAFVIAVAVALVATIVAVVVGVVANRPPEYVEGDEIGVYYYDVEAGEVVLTLSGGNNFTIAGPNMNKTGTYTVDGTTLHLDFFKDEDGVTTATINGDSLALIYGDATMMFVRKLDYTVSFNVNGGSEIAPVKVVNGKTLAKPADPTKENSVFLGWYADEALTVPYSFDSVAIKADATIYAKWADKTVGVAESVVDFDLGYEGAAALAPITTVSGKAYGVTTPEREGYTFGGWWISMYEDGAKLSYAYTEDTTFAADTTLFAVWYDNASAKLNAPAVSVTADMITWNAVDGASGYLLTVVAPDGTVLIDNETIGATTKAYSFEDLAAGEYKISVVAVANNADNNSEPAERYYANKALDRVANFQVVNGILVFGAVENAEKYLITIDCGDDQHVHTAFDNGLSTIYYLGNCPMQKGGILITVTAMANGYASSVSEIFVYDLTLDKIPAVEYDKATDTFVWDVIPGASTYYVTVTVGENTYTYNIGNVTTFNAAPFTGNVTVNVTPAAEGYNSPEATKATCEKTAPAMPEGLTLSDMVISWNAVEGAASYEVKIGEMTTVVTTNSLNLAESSMSLSQGQYYEVQVRSISAGNDASVYSESLKFGYFAMDPVLSYNKNTVTWAPVLGINEFQIKVNNGEIRVIRGANSAKVTLTQEGENLIEVRYIYGDTASDWASITVVAHTVEYDTRSSSGSLFEYLAVGDEMALPDAGFESVGYNFAGWYNSPKGSAGNGKPYAAGTTFNGNAYTVVYATWTPKDYNVSLQTGGLGFAVTNIENGKQETVTYTRDFVLTVPQATNTGMYYFAGWYTGPAGTGVQITDENGVSVNPYPYTRDIVLYPYYSTNALSFVLQEDGTYGVTRGSSIDTVTNLVIPVTYNEKPVTVILENAFSGCSSLITVQIPDTIRLVGTGAFSSPTNLVSIEVYKAKEGTYETFYSSEDGTLIRRDIGDVYYLEAVPKGKTGHFTIPSIVEKILPKAFNYSKLESVTIPNNVITLPEYSFYGCSSLKTVTFEPGRTNPLEMQGKVFTSCSKLETIVLPAKLAHEFASLKSMFNEMTGLRSIEIEDGGEMYASVGGLLTSAEKDKILYCPRAYTGALSIPLGVTTIGADAFYYCNKITSVTIPVWVTSIEKQAFYYMSGLEEVIFKGGRSDDLHIGQSAFSSDYAIKTVTFEGNVTGELDTGAVTMDKLVFWGSNLSSKMHTLTIGAGANIETLGEQMFYNQAKLKNVIIEKGARIGTIGVNAFYGCVSLASFHVPATVTSISQYAFAGCSGLATLTFEEQGATTLDIANYAFNNCTRLSSVTLPDHLETFNSAAFQGCDALKQLTVNSTNPGYLTDSHGILYKKDTDASGNVVYSEVLFYPTALIKENNGVINNLPDTLTKIGGAAFSNNLDLISITIPAGVTLIDTNAFYNCECLETVIFLGANSPEGKTLTIGQKAFANCYSLSDDFRLPSYTKKLDFGAFQGAGMKKFVIPEGITSIGKAAFYGCANLETVEFLCTGNFVIENGTARTAATGGAFGSCTALKSVTFPATLVELGNYAFDTCTSLESVTFGTVTTTVGPNGEVVYDMDSKLIRIGNRAFFQCAALKSINVPASVKAIGQYAFCATQTTNAGSPGQLESIIFELGGKDTLYIGTNAFQYQGALETITLPARVSLASPFNGTTNDANGNKITKVPTVSDYLKTTKANSYVVAFKNCLSLKEINIAKEEGISCDYATIDGVLYTADLSMLLFCPIANVGAYENGQPTYELVVPKEVQLVLSQSMMDLVNLKTLTFEEFDKSDANYGKQLVTFGHYTDASNTAKTNPVLGGTTCSVTTVNMPSHLAKISGGSFAVNTKEPTPMTINFNMDAKNVELGQNAFRFSLFVELNLPNIKSMGTYTFSESYLLEAVHFSTLASSVTTLPQYAFNKVATLKGFDVPAQIKTIDASAFRECSGLTSFAIPSTVTKLGNYAFYKTGLTSITIPNSIKGNANLGTYLFNECPNLTTVHFEVDSTGKSPITKIPSSMFYHCYALTNINLMDLTNVTAIDSSAFYGCPISGIDFTQFTKLTSVGATAFRETNLEMVDLSKTQIKSVTTGFCGIKTLKTIIFPDNAISGWTYQTLQDCPNLETVVLPKNIDGSLLFPTAATTIFRELFQDAPNVNVVIPEGNPNFGVDEFGVVYDPNFQVIYYAAPGLDLSEYVIPDTVMTISIYAFARNKTLGDFEITEGVQTIGQYAFAYTDMTSILIPSSVTVIDKNAFTESKIKYVNFVDTIESPSQLTTIGDNAFVRSAIESIVIPDSVTSYGKSLFQYCDNIKSVTTGAGLTEVATGFIGYSPSLEELHLQEGVKKINWIFNSSYYIGDYGPHKMKSFTVPASVETLGPYAFCDMTSLETITFAPGSKLKEIQQDAFNNCVSLKNITLPASVESIEEASFSNCISLETIDLSQTGVSEIAESVFADTIALKSIVLPKNLTAIGDYAFYNTGLESITFSAVTTKFGISAFENAKSLKTVTFAADSLLSTLGALVDDADKRIESNLFRGTTSLETIVIPNTVREIGHHAFENSSVANIVMTDPTAPSDLQTIGDYAFANCEGLVEFEHLSNIINIGTGAFYQCFNLEKAELGENLETLSAMAFGFCNKLDKAYIPAKVAVMNGNPYAGLDASIISLSPDNEAFVLKTNADGALILMDTYNETVYGVYGATGKYTIGENRPDPVYAIGALAGNAITELHIPTIYSKMVDLPDYFLMNCTELTTVTMEEGFKTIGQYAFYNTGLKTIEIPTTVTKMGDYAFAMCTSIDNLFMPKALVTFGSYCFAGCTTLSNFEFEETTSARTLGTHFFYNCINITEVILPTKVNSTTADAANTEYTSQYQNTIPSYMFAGTGIVHAVVPEQVLYFHTNGVFANCKNLTKVTFTKHAASSSAPINANMFEGCDKWDGIIYIPTLTDKMCYIVEMMMKGGCTEVHVETMDREDSVVEFQTTARFNYSDETVSIHFDSLTYEQIIKLFAAVTNPWTVNVYDCDGNQLFSADESGHIAYVKNANGQIIWQAQ